MEDRDARGVGRGGDGDSVMRQSLDFLRKRSLHRVRWSSARIAIKRGHSGEPPHQPNGHRATGKRV